MDVMALEETAAAIPDIISIVEMTPSQAAQSLKTPTGAPAPAGLKRLRARHHKAAKLVAAGHKNVDIARKTGYAPTTISILKANPAFMELVEHYSGEFDESTQELHERMEALAYDLLTQIEEKVDDDDDISLSDLRTAFTDVLDRIGKGPIKRVEKHSVNEHRHVGIIQRVREVAAEKRYDLGPGTAPFRELPTMPASLGTGMGGVEEQGALVKTPDEVLDPPTAPGDSL